jgi:tRNA 2-thiouridine synthesizing protein C
VTDTVLSAKRFLVVNRRAPHGSIYALEALEVVLAAAAFEQVLSLLFLDDGVFQLKSGQDTSRQGTRNFSRTFRALEMYDVEQLYVEAESLRQRGLTADDLLLPVTLISSAEVGELMERQDVLLNF